MKEAFTAIAHTTLNALVCSLYLTNTLWCLLIDSLMCHIVRSEILIQFFVMMMCNIYLFGQNLMAAHNLLCAKSPFSHLKPFKCSFSSTNRIRTSDKSLIRAF